jgi:hypothetical protein
LPAVELGPDGELLGDDDDSFDFRPPNGWSEVRSSGIDRKNCSKVIPPWPLAVLFFPKAFRTSAMVLLSFKQAYQIFVNAKWQEFLKIVNAF